MLDLKDVGVCPICGNTEMEPGFGGRVHKSGKKPQCAKCKSAERHRLINLMYKALRPVIKDMRALQFAPEGSVKPEWFARYDYSIYGGHNSLDMTNMELEDGAYDIIMSNHVIEHVESDFKALQESLRVVGPKGVVHVTAPSPMFRFETVDWGFADPKKNEHFRDYGADMGRYLLRAAPDAHCLGVVGMDPVTLVTDIVYFFSQNKMRLETIAAALSHSDYPCVVVS